MSKKSVMTHVLGLMLLALPLYSGAKTVEGVEVPGTYSYEGQELALSGAGSRSKWFMDLYVAGLYLSSAEPGSASIILETDEPQAITLNIISGMITSERMKEATLEGFDAATEGDTSAIQGDIDRFIAVFEEAIKEGDSFTLVYMPEEGVSVLKNGEHKDTIGDLAFKQALFGIWLSDNPVDKGLKAGMLGQR
ncbi:MAG: chalcone isomerase family protein [Marinobacter sp.]|nr:chalcone isomerase family protein [Marinobacter sp.]